MDRKKYLREWHKNNREKSRKYWRDWWTKNKDRALILVGRGELKCVRCGDTKRSWLEINHKNGGGNKERRENGLTGQGLKRAIMFGRRSIEDLEILCKPCNLVHAAEIMGGKKYQVIRIE